MAETEPSREATAEERAKWLAEARKADAEAVKAEAEAAKVRIEQEAVAVSLAVAQIGLRGQQRTEAEQLAANKFHHVYHFTSAVNESSVRGCLEQLTVWRRNDPSCDIELIFTSPGGQIIEGMALFDYLLTLRREGHRLTTVALGMAASMAGILMQAGTVRAMGKEAYVLIHQVSFGAYGKIGEVEDEVKFVHMIQDRVLDLFAERAAEAGRNGTASKPLSRAGFKRNWERKDWWLDSRACLQFGIVDEVR